MIIDPIYTYTNAASLDEDSDFWRELYADIQSSSILQSLALLLRMTFNRIFFCVSCMMIIEYMNLIWSNLI
ncbi:hypothetical protein PRECH8_19970 [Insulibacter thermoxylanivorax]|uniref:Uncharacterized protein n=1 Tax=Insulibacter thermoxylanivorax TaxID=2749268 RepID=A0A916QHT2_9BACL|nr:hypothetical protein [Insulibacter thermoxylanivorax]GFR38701.1 hypothetical protein PRECH8_19970 [Insulibacter thermoxylanivorax]